LKTRLKLLLKRHPEFPPIDISPKTILKCRTVTLHNFQIIHSLAGRDRQERNPSNIFSQKHYQVQGTRTCAAIELPLHYNRTTPDSQHLDHSFMTPLNDVSDGSADYNRLQSFRQSVNSLMAELSPIKGCLIIRSDTPPQIPPVCTPSDHKNLNPNYCWSSALFRPGILNIASPLHSWHPAVLSNEIPIGKQ
jgi:hypothetical protein